MGVVTVSSSAARTPLGLNTKHSHNRLSLKRPLIVAFNGDKSNNTTLVAPQEQVPLPIEASSKGHHKRIGKNNKFPKRARAVFTDDEPSPSNLDVDYDEAAAKLENIYKLSPASDTRNAEVIDDKIKRVSRRRKKTSDDDKEGEINNEYVVRNRNKKARRLSLDKRIALKNNRNEDVVVPTRKERKVKNRIEKIEELVREYSASTD